MEKHSRKTAPPASQLAMGHNRTKMRRRQNLFDRFLAASRVSGASAATLFLGAHFAEFAVATKNPRKAGFSPKTGNSAAVAVISCSGAPASSHASSRALLV